MDLEARFAQTARAAGAAAGPAALAAVAAELIARWSEPHRHYHNVTHLRAVLDEVEAEPVVALAAWGHDAVYDPRSSANEERSAFLLSGMLLNRCRIPVDQVREAYRLVLLTAGHASTSDDHLGQLLADADLAILATPWPQYESYVDAVRAEYAHVPPSLWQIGRSAVLQSLLDLPKLYHLHPEREEPARTNLAHELTQLAQ